jgi:uncharacterized membrane protein YqgA involved in biofilm formation
MARTGQHNGAVFLSGTLLNVATVLIGTTVGVLVGARLPSRLHGSLTMSLGFFTLTIALSMALRIFAAGVPAGDDVAILAALLAGVAVGEALRLQDGLEWLGGWFQRRFSRVGSGSRVAEAFITASIVFCVGPLTILGSLDNGLRGDMKLLSIKSLLDGVASIAFGAALGPGVYLSALTVLVVQGAIAGTAFLVSGAMDAATILAITSAGGLILVGIALRLLDLKRVPVANFLPALVFAPLFVRVAELIRGALA